MTTTCSDTIPPAIQTFLILFDGLNDSQVKECFHQLDVDDGGGMELSELILAMRVANFRKLKTAKELVDELNKYKVSTVKTRHAKDGSSTTRHETRVKLDYKIEDAFTTGTPEESAAYMAQFRKSLQFLDKDSNGSVDVDEIITCIRQSREVSSSHSIFSWLTTTSTTKPKPWYRHIRSSVKSLFSLSTRSNKEDVVTNVVTNV